MATDSYVSFADASPDDDFPNKSTEDDPLFAAVEPDPLSLKKNKKSTRKNSIASCDSTAPVSEEEEKPTKSRRTRSMPTPKKNKSISKMKKSKSMKKEATASSNDKSSEIGAEKSVSKMKKKRSVKSMKKTNTSIAAAADKTESMSKSKKSFTLNGTRSEEADLEDCSISTKENRSCATPASVVRALGTGLRKAKKKNEEKGKKNTATTGKIKPSDKVQQKIKRKKKKDKVCSGDDIKANTLTKKKIKKKMIYQ